MCACVRACARVCVCACVRVRVGAWVRAAWVLFECDLLTSACVRVTLAHAGFSDARGRVNDASVSSISRYKIFRRAGMVKARLPVTALLPARAHSHQTPLFFFFFFLSGASPPVTERRSTSINNIRRRGSMRGGRGRSRIRLRRCCVFVLMARCCVFILLCAHSDPLLSPDATPSIKLSGSWRCSHDLKNPPLTDATPSITVSG